METYNWIKVYYHEAIVKIRQASKGSATFVDGAGNEFNISELDFTRDTFEPQIFNLEELEKLNKDMNQQYQENQAIYMEMLSKMDANSIADHKAKIDEREYWRKLRGDIALEIIRKRGDNSYYSDVSHYKTIAWMAETLFNKLYEQDQEFFKDK